MTPVMAVLATNTASVVLMLVTTDDLTATIPRPWMAFGSSWATLAGLLTALRGVSVGPGWPPDGLEWWVHW